MILADEAPHGEPCFTPEHLAWPWVNAQSTLPRLFSMGCRMQGPRTELSREAKSLWAFKMMPGREVGREEGGFDRLRRDDREGGQRGG